MDECVYGSLVESMYPPARDWKLCLATHCKFVLGINESWHAFRVHLERPMMQTWDSLQAMCSYLRGILATKALLEGVGVGNGRSFTCHVPVVQSRARRGHHDIVVMGVQ